MAEWLIEEGIGETRAILVDHGETVAARLDWPGGLKAGQIEDARLTSRHKGSSRGTARFASGEEALVSQLPRDASEGATLRLVVTRPALGEAGRRKLAQARPSREAPRAAPSLAETMAQDGLPVRVAPRFAEGDWNAIMGDALGGEIDFAGGVILLSPTPAMTLIDIDGTLPPRDLALAAVPAIGAALRRLDLGGSIGIDFPTLPAKEDRRAVDEALAAELTDFPHERTAMNGFGFVQIVARLARPSILHRARFDGAGAAARWLLRQAEGVQEPGALLLTCAPAVADQLGEPWLEELARRTGREIRVEARGGLALHGGFAQAVSL